MVVLTQTKRGVEDQVSATAIPGWQRRYEAKSSWVFVSIVVGLIETECRGNLYGERGCTAKRGFGRESESENASESDG
jgi:hypothetical protein